MDFFDLSSFSSSSITMDHFREWAGLVSGSYMSSGQDPSDSIAKIAQDESLTPDQISTLVGESNKMIHQQKFASADEKYHAANFPLADTSKILSKLQVDGSQEKVAFFISDPVFETGKNIDPFEMFGVEQEDFCKRASLKTDLKAAQEKLALMKQKIDDSVITSEYAVKTAENNFVKEARNMILKNSFNLEDRVGIVKEIFEFGKTAGHDNEIARPLAKLAMVLTKAGEIDTKIGNDLSKLFLKKASFQKTADEKAPQSLISPNLKARIINGKHPLYGTLKTFVSVNNALNENLSRQNIIVDKLNLTKQYIRAL